MMIAVMVVRTAVLLMVITPTITQNNQHFLNTGYSSEHLQYTNLTPTALLEVGKLFLVPLFYRCFNNIFVIFVVVND